MNFLALFVLCFMLPVFSQESPQNQPFPFGPLDGHPMKNGGETSERSKLGSSLVIPPTIKKWEKKEFPATHYIFTSQQISDRGYVNLIDLLQDVPGMETIPYYFSEIGTLVPVRGGIGNNKIVVMVNGIPVNPPGGEEMPLRNDISIRHAERIEVIVGPGTVLKSQGSLSAVINIIMQKPEEHLENRILVAGDKFINPFGDFYLSFSKDFRKISSFSFFIQRNDYILDTLPNKFPLLYHSRAGAGNFHRNDEGLNWFARIEYDNHLHFQLWFRESERSSSEGGYYESGKIYFPFADSAVWKDKSIIMDIGDKYRLNKYNLLTTSFSFNKYEAAPHSRYRWLEDNDKDGNWELSDIIDYKYARGTAIDFNLHWQSLLGFGWLNLSSLPSVNLNMDLCATHKGILPKFTSKKDFDPHESPTGQSGDWYYINPSLKIHNDTFFHSFDSAASSDSTIIGTLVKVPKTHSFSYSQIFYNLKADWPMMDDKLDISLGFGMPFSSFYDYPLFPKLFGAMLLRPYPGLDIRFTLGSDMLQPAPYYGYSTFYNGKAFNTVNPNLRPEKIKANEISFSYSNTHQEKSSLKTLHIFRIELVLYKNKFNDILLYPDKNKGEFDIFYFDYSVADSGKLDTIYNARKVKLTQSSNADRETQVTGLDLSASYRYDIGDIWRFNDVSVNTWGFLTLLQLKEDSLAQNLFNGISSSFFRLGATLKLGDFTLSSMLMYRKTPNWQFDMPDSTSQNKSELKHLQKYQHELMKHPWAIDIHCDFTVLNYLKVFATVKNLSQNNYALGGLQGPAPQEGRKIKIGILSSLEF